MTRFFIENKVPLELEEEKLAELLSYFLDFLRGKNSEANSVGSAAKVGSGDKRVVPLEKLQEVVRNSAFSDILFDKFEVEFSRLSFVIESRQDFTPELRSSPEENKSKQIGDLVFFILSDLPASS